MSVVDSSGLSRPSREHGPKCRCFNCRGKESAERRERGLSFERARLAPAFLESSDVDAEVEVALPAEDASDGGRGSPDRAADEAGDCWADDSPPYLESNRKFVEQEEEESSTWYELRSCGCRSRFCPRCAIPQGLKLRSRLQPVLTTFTKIQMWTLTIDPQLFSSPAEAFEYARKKRCLAEWVRSLKDRGVLHSGRFFCVIEWQKNTEMVHFHILLDASYIPFEIACDLWNRFRPENAKPVEGKRPGFGSVRYSDDDFKGPEHAAAYACKYMIKHPDHGYPDWVLDSRGEIKRYSTSKGFWTEQLDEAKNNGLGNTDCDREQDPAKNMAPEQELPERSTIRERLAQCGRTAVVLEVAEVVDDKGEVHTSRRFMHKLGARFPDLLLRLGLNEKGVNAIRLRPGEVNYLLEWQGERVRGSCEGVERQLDTGVHNEETRSDQGTGSYQRFGAVSVGPSEATAGGAERCGDAGTAAAGPASDSR